MVTKRAQLLFFFFLLFSFFRASSQQQQQQQVVKDIMERIGPELSDDFDLSEVWDQLSYFADHPLNLSRATASDLKKLYILSPLQISNFFSYVEKNSPLLDLSELQAIDGFDSRTIEDLLPFVTLKERAAYGQLKFKDLIQKSESDLILRYAQVVEAQRGYHKPAGSHYMGTPVKLLAKYRYHFNQLVSFSLVAKKDAGEEFFSGSNKQGFDFQSFGLSVNQLGIFKKTVVGDYSLQFGQGLTLWSGFSFGKGPDVASVAKQDVGLKPYSSSNESSFLRGVATTVAINKHIHITGFFSYRKLDASQTLLADSTYAQVNIATSGLHRTQTEIKNHNRLGQMIFGTAVQYTNNQLTLGAVGYRSNYQSPFITGNQLYNAKGFTGNKLSNAGLHFNYTFLNIYFFGEAATSLDGGEAYLAGAMTSITPKLSAVVVNRKYDENHHSFFSQAFGENSESANEQGWYAGLTYQPYQQWKGALYLDAFKFPWLKYRVNEPSSGYEAMTEITYQPSKTFRTQLRIKTKENQQNTDLDVPVKYLDQVSKQNYRLEVNWQLSQKMRFQNRIEWCVYRKGQTLDQGYLVYQDISYAPLSSKFSGNLRLAYFHTDSYNSRLYAYEDDVLYGFSFGMYNGKGARTFVNLKYKLLRNLDVWGRYAMFIYSDAETVGSGLDEIQGNKKSEVKFQLRYQF